MLFPFIYSHSSTNGPFFFRLCQFPVATVIKQHRLATVTEQKFIPEAEKSESLSLEQNQDAEGPPSFCRFLKGICSLPLQASDGCQDFLACTCIALTFETSIFKSLFVLFSCHFSCVSGVCQESEESFHHCVLLLSFSVQAGSVSEYIILLKALWVLCRQYQGPLQMEKAKPIHHFKRACLHFWLLLRRLSDKLL